MITAAPRCNSCRQELQLNLWLRHSPGTRVSASPSGLAQKVPAKGQFSLFLHGFDQIHQKSPNPLLIHFHQPLLGSLFVPNLSLLPQPPNEDVQCLPSVFALMLIYNHIFSGNQPIYSLTLIRSLRCTTAVQNFIITYRPSFHTSKLY